MKNNRAFARSQLMLTNIMAIMNANVSVFEQHLAIQGLGEYKSRGKGGKFGVSRSRPNFDSGHATNFVRGLGKPKRELVSTPRRMWVGFDEFFHTSEYFTTRRAALRYGDGIAVLM